MLWQILSIEYTKITKRQMFWVELAIMAFAILIIELALYANFNNPGSNVIPADERIQLQQMITWPGALVTALNLTGGNAIGGILLVILAGTVTAQEYRWRTLQLLLSRGVSRPLLGIAKYTALVFPALSIVLIATLTSCVISFVMSMHLNGTLLLGQINVLQLVLSIARTICTLLPYGALTFMLAIASRSSAVAIACGTAFTLLIEDLLMQLLGLFGDMAQHISQYFPTALSESLLSMNQAINGIKLGIPASPTDPWIACLGLIAWTLLFLGLSLFILQRQDLSE